MNQKVQNRVEEHADYVKGQIGEEVWFVTALQGSQNYQMSDEHSDVDTKSIVIPSFRSLVFNDKRTSKTLEVAPTIEHSDVKDMREMINCWKKQNINFIEIIFTKWYTVNPTMQWAWDSIWVIREEIAHMNPYNAINSMCGCMREKYHAFDHPYPSAMEKIEKFGYDPKQLSHMLRYKNFLERYFNDEPYEKCLVPANPQEYIDIKRGSIPLKDALQIREEAFKWQADFLEKYKGVLKNETNPKTEKMLNEIMYELFVQVAKNDDY